MRSTEIAPIVLNPLGNLDNLDNLDSFAMLSGLGSSWFYHGRWVTITVHLTSYLVIDLRRHIRALYLASCRQDTYLGFFICDLLQGLPISMIFALATHSSVQSVNNSVSQPGGPTPFFFDLSFRMMMAHGGRRAAEMCNVARRARAHTHTHTHTHTPMRWDTLTGPTDASYVCVCVCVYVCVWSFCTTHTNLRYTTNPIGQSRFLALTCS